jgi:hypothetical protein
MANERGRQQVEDRMGGTDCHHKYDKQPQHSL